MKRLFATVLAGAMLCTGIPALTASAEETTYQLGDVTMDGKIDMDDAILILRYYVRETFMGETDLLNDEQRALADVEHTIYPTTSTGSPITVTDARMVLIYYVTTSVLGYSNLTMEEFVADWYSYLQEIEGAEGK